jgi:hypothetical protein
MEEEKPKEECNLLPGTSLAQGRVPGMRHRRQANTPFSQTNSASKHATSN